MFQLTLKDKKKDLKILKVISKISLTFDMTEDMESEINFCNQNMKESCS